MDKIIIQNIEKSISANVRVISGNKSVTLHSVEPFKEAQRICKHFNPDIEWILIAGFGLGYIVEYLIKNTSANIIVFEHSQEIIDYAKEIRNINSLLTDKRVHLIQGEISKVTEFLDKNNIKELNFYIHRPYLTLFPEIYSNLQGILIAYLSKKQINKATLKRFQKVWLRNIIKNSIFYFGLPGIKDIEHTFHNKPAVIVGAGPSLSKNIHIIKKYKERFLLISTDTAYSTLSNEEIEPDFVVSVDPQDKNTLYLLYSPKNSFLIIDAGASFLSLTKYNLKKTILFDTIFPAYETFKHFWGEKGSLLCGGSVSTAAFDLARFFNCNPIIFAGQDLAYSKKQTHTRGNVLEEFLYYKINRFHTYEDYNAKMLFLSDKIEINGWNGEKVSTDRKFLTFIEWFRKEFQYTKGRIINSTEGGAFIEGIEHIPLEKAIEKYCDNTISREFKIHFSQRSDEEYKNILFSLMSVLDTLIPSSVLALEASKNVLLKIKNGSRNITQEISIMSKFDKSLSSAIKKNPALGRLLEMTMQSSIEAVTDLSDKSIPTIEVMKKWENFYKEAQEGLAYIQHLLKKRKKISG